MTKEFQIAAWIGVAAVLVTVAVFRFPALTSGSSTAGFDIPEEQYASIVANERDFCADNLEGVNCRCFAGVAGVIIADAEPRVPTARYADKTELARGQAADKC